LIHGQERRSDPLYLPLTPVESPNSLNSW
jgi:hypothetical protein